MMYQNKENKEGDTMDVDGPEASNGHVWQLKRNGLILYPVPPNGEGEGLPYAPADWPNPGDTWGWRVGKRTSLSGYYLDRYLYLPSSLSLQKSRRGRDVFASKLSVKQHLQAKFPNVDAESFLASFSWKIPSKQVFIIKEHETSSCMLSGELSEPSLSNCQNGGPACKAGNRLCSSLTEEEKVSSIATTMFCDICCSEPNFCRECCCILCCKPLDLAFGGYGFIRCLADVNDGMICGHAAHLVCALRSYMAGTVGGTIAIDAEYYCRRCDSRTGLVEHVTKIFKMCEPVESRDDIKKMLNLAICLLRGSQKKNAKRLLNRAQMVLQKSECGNALSDIWILEDDISTVRIAEDEAKIRDSRPQNPSQTPSSLQNEYNKINEEVEQVLQELKGSQQYEYKIAEKKLLAQRDLLFQLYQQRDTEKLAHRGSAATIAQTEEKIKREMTRLKDMKKLGKGFGRVPKNVLEEYFDLDMKD